MSTSQNTRALSTKAADEASRAIELVIKRFPKMAFCSPGQAPLSAQLCQGLWIVGHFGSREIAGSSCGVVDLDRGTVSIVPTSS